MARFRRHRNLFIAMLNVQCYLRPLRRKWGLTQAEMASLLEKGDRSRVSDVERGVTRPNAAEIVAYPLIFGVKAERIFPRACADAEDIAMAGAAGLYEKLLTKAETPEVIKKRQLMLDMLERATKKGKAQQI